MATEEVQERLPVLYFGHGAPPLADDALWTGQFASWAAELPRPRAVLIVSAHWESAPVTIGATTTVPLVHDFWGFPERYYRVTYPAPGAPRLAESVRGLLGGSGVPVADEPARGLDHGAYVPLKEMYPDADVPVLQISMPTLDPRRLFDLGRRLAPLRDEGVLVMGSGFLTHNLSCVDMSLGADREPPSWSAEFDDWANRAAQAGDIDALLDWRAKAPAAAVAHPRSEHLAPLFVALGAGGETTETARSVIDGFWYGLAKRAFQFD
ncbi:dioxygenase [Thermobifida halotolerans]|uniref:Dioxygenase n=1 Tax=Thermobifida halotolerans TaxID=483545 RepID=A0A399G154_9ACTN|nr:class III extradiol ring-cleavage dioxygenase [Thermobifida halotolerans]UOE19430.1 dioxygenase [Thermobifida halotolerans]